MFKSEKGASAVEFALIAPLLLVLTFGIIEFSVLLFDKAVVTNASREGARAAIVYNTNPTTGNWQKISETAVKKVVTDYTDKYLISLGGSSTPVSVVTYPTGTGPRGDVLVTVTYPYNFLVFPDVSKLIGGSFNGTVSLVGSTLMRME